MRVFVVAALLCVCTAKQYWNWQGEQVSADLTSVDPGLCDANVKQYAGYFNIDAKTDKNYFYWSFESRSQPDTDPIVLWMTGGPGCSSQLALLSENGPCHVNKDGATTYNNPYSWTTKANVVWVDQPADVGFSYSNRAGLDHNEKEVAEDMYQFIQAFIKDHPKWANNKFIITGESYGGHYVPAVSHRVWQGNQNGEGAKINLAAVAIGNGLTDPEIQYSYYGQLAYNYSITKLGHPAISLKAYETMMKELPNCIELITKCQTGSVEMCSIAQSTCNQAQIGPYEATGLNPYDIRRPCGSNPLCYDFSMVNTFLNSQAVQQKLNVSRKWESCNYEVNGAFSGDWMKNYQNQLPDLLAAKIPILIYAGDVDFICNWLGNHAWTEALPWPGKAAFNSAQFKDWKINGNSTAAGQVKGAQGLTFLRVYDAGHMVPSDQPAAALAMINTVISGGSF